jgi:acid phosphatase family membrane protein YuiD
MNWLLGLLSNPFLLTVVIAWISAQILKVVTHAFVYKEFDIKRLWGDGGMPSAHTATVCSLAAFAAISYGPASFEFAVCAIMALIVCRDAVGVRMETGKQAQVINELLKSIDILTDKELSQTKLKEFVGHTPVQVITGILLGIANACLMYFVVLQ